MYQIVRVTGKDGVAKAGAEGLGYIGEPKMEDGCVLIHCRHDRRGDPCDRYIRTSLVRTWKKDKVTGRVVLETKNSIYHMAPVKTST